MIRKVKGGYRVYSHRKHNGRRLNLGTYPTKPKARARLRQLKRFA